MRLPLLLLIVILSTDSVTTSSKKIRLIDKKTTGKVGITQSNQAPDEPNCQCNSKTAWVDLIFVVDASAATGKDGLQQIWQFAQTLLQSLTIEKTGDTFSTNSSRMGIVTYGNKATVFQDLGMIDNADLGRTLTLPYNGDDHTNLQLGLEAAEVQFNLHGNPNAPQIIVVMAMALHSAVGYNPVKMSIDLQEEGATVMVYQFISKGDVSLELGHVASLDYFFSTKYNNSKDDVIQAICDANCQCSTDYSSVYKTSIRGAPLAGCYETPCVQANYNLAMRKCAMFDGGYLPTVTSQEKSVYLLSQTRQRPFLLGLTFNDSRWQWSDGSELGEYHPWKPGTKHDGSGNLECVYVDTELLWNPVDCRSGQFYVCEAAPCDSTQYCKIKDQ